MEEHSKKQQLFRGKTIEELKTIEVRAFAQYLTARQRRSVLRKFQEIEQFVKDAKVKISKKKPIRTHNRDLIVVPELVGMNIQIYNGKTFVPVDITVEMLGHFFGEFSLTRNKVNHGTAGIGATKGSKAAKK